MNKRGLALSSLVMAIPAGLLAYLSVKSVFEMNESMPTLVTIIIWTLIVLSGLIALSPFIFLIAGPSGAAALPIAASAEPAPVADPKKKPGQPKSDDEDEFAEDEDLSEAGDDQLFDTSDEEAGADDFEDDFNFDDDDAIEEEEEPAPKKKKKK